VACAGVPATAGGDTSVLPIGWAPVAVSRAVLSEISPVSAGAGKRADHPTSTPLKGTVTAVPEIVLGMTVQPVGSVHSSDSPVQGGSELPIVAAADAWAGAVSRTSATPRRASIAD
jgi:hypothetical protein